MSDSCKSCGADIMWAITPKGRRIPIDPEPVEAGNVRIEPRLGRSMPLAVVMSEREAATRPGYVSHFASCPNAARHRKRERKAK